MTNTTTQHAASPKGSVPMTSTTIHPAHRFAAQAELDRLQRLVLAAGASPTPRHMLLLRTLRLATYAESFPTSYAPTIVAASEQLLALCLGDVNDAGFLNAAIAVAEAAVAADRPSERSLADLLTYL